MTTYMGMQVLPNYSFADAPEPDVLVLPGGNTGDALDDPEIRAWVDQTVATADHVLTTCTGIFFLVGNELLEGSKVTTWYGRQNDLRQAAAEAHVVADQLVVESGKLVSAAGLGVEGSLRVLARLHGPAWAEVVRLNMEYEPIPDSLRVPRVELADFDHVIGLPAIRDRYPDAQVVIHEDDFVDMQTQLQWVLENMSQDFIDFLKSDPERSKLLEFDARTFGKPDILIEDNQVLRLGEHEIRAIHSPGHSRGSVCFYADDMLFSGDVLFYRSVGRTDVQNSSLDEQIASARRLYELPAETVVYPAHGRATDIGTERIENKRITLDAVNMQ